MRKVNGVSKWGGVRDLRYRVETSRAPSSCAVQFGAALAPSQVASDVTEVGSVVVDTCPACIAVADYRIHVICILSVLADLRVSHLITAPYATQSRTD